MKVNVAEHVEWARRIARRLGRSLPWLGADDAEGIGLLALVEVAPRWREGEAASFRTFAYKRICGAILSTQRKRCRRQEHREVAVVDACLSTIDPLALVSMETEVAAKQVVARVTAKLDARSAAVVLRHVTDELSQDVAYRFGVHPSRVTQIEAQAMAAAREALGITAEIAKPAAIQRAS